VGDQPEARAVGVTENLTAVHRLRLSQADAHYGGALVAGARLLEFFGDVATELSIRHDGDEGLLAGYSSVEFLAPVHAGDFLEIRGEITRVGTTSREMAFGAFRYAAPRGDISDSAADVLGGPEIVARAVATCVVRKARQR
jgi:3-aminobutyryl-CoA ammonia-lyase